MAMEASSSNINDARFTPSIDKYKKKFDHYRYIGDSYKSDNNLSKMKVIYKNDLRGMHSRIEKYQEDLRKHLEAVVDTEEKLARTRLKKDAWLKLADHYEQLDPSEKADVKSKELADYLIYKYQMGVEDMEWEDNIREAASITGQSRESLSFCNDIFMLKYIRGALKEGGVSLEGKYLLTIEKKGQNRIKAIARKDHTSARIVADLYRESIRRHHHTLDRLPQLLRDTTARLNGWQELYDRTEARYGYQGHLDSPPQLSSPIFTDKGSSHGEGTEEDHFGSVSDTCSDV